MTAIATWPAAAETWLDERGKPAWIAAMVLGFILFWPVGLALLAYMIWSNRMSCNGRSLRKFRRHGIRRRWHYITCTYDNGGSARSRSRPTPPRVSTCPASSRTSPAKTRRT